MATVTGVVPIAALAKVRLSSGLEQINHRERQRTITIQVTPPADIALQDAIERTEREMIAQLQASGQLGSEYVINLSL